MQYSVAADVLSAVVRDERLLGSSRGSLVPDAWRRCCALVVVLALVACWACPARLIAMPASPEPYDVVQPGGAVITLQIRGDEYFSWEEDAEGYTVVRNAAGVYVYAELDATGRLAPTTLVVGVSDPATAGLQRGALPSLKVRNQRRAMAAEVQGGVAAAASQPPSTGTVKNLTVLIRFSNHTGRTLPSQSDVDVIMNATSPHATLAPTGSVRAAYLENSYALLTVDSTVTPWYTVSGTEQFYADGTSGGLTWMALVDALNQADATINFNDFDTDSDGWIDAIAFLHSGYGAEWGGTDVDGTYYLDRIWSHKSSIQTWTSAEGVKVSSYHISPGLWGTSGSDPGRIGVICHETGHFFGLPDLYDTSGGGAGIGSYGMMANSWGFDRTQYYPPHFSAWSKVALGWVTPTVLSSPGNYAAAQVQTNQVIYEINAGFPAGEYLLIENRQPVGLDGLMPQGGLCIWHIDNGKSSNTNEGWPGQLGWPGNNNHYRIALLQADGYYNLEKGSGPWPLDRGDAGDVYRGAAVDRIDATTLPNTHSYQGGVAAATNHRIHNISVSGSSMTFDYDTYAPSTGACCNDTNETCDETWTTTSCMQSGANRFLEGDVCSSFTPACGTRACCTRNDNGTPANPLDDFAECADALQSTCAGAPLSDTVCGDPGALCPLAQCINAAGDCATGHGGIGCDAVSCCELVCGIDPSCCDTAWDASCAALAVTSCAYNDDCSSSVEIFDGVTAFDNTLATTDGPDGCGADVGTKDLWYTYEASCTGNVTVSLCDNTNFDNTLHIYGGTGCAPVGPRLSCEDDSCGWGGGPAIITVPANGGDTFLIRVGGWNGATGPGEINVSCNLSNDGDTCDTATVTTVPVGAPGSPITTTINGDSTTATGPDCGGEITTSWWEAFTIDRCSKVTIDFCGTAPYHSSNYIGLKGACGDSGNFCGNWVGSDSFNRDDCGDNNATFVFDAIPAGTYYYPLVSNTPERQHPYVMHITAEECTGGCWGCLGGCCDTIAETCVDFVTADSCAGINEQWELRAECCEMECRDPAGPEYDSWNVELLSYVPFWDFSSGSWAANDVWGYTSPLGRKYAILGLSNGTGFVDITDPRNPVIIADIPDANSSWSDMKTFGEYAYNVMDNPGDPAAGSGMQVIDMTGIDSGTVSLLGVAPGGLRVAHNVYVNPDSGYAYACGTDVGQGFAVFDVSNPSAPVPVTTWADYYVHDMQVVNYASCPTDAGHIRSGLPCEIAFLFTGYDGFVILDVTDKFAMINLTPGGVLTYPELSYCHQGWVSEDRRYVYMNDELDELWGAISNVRTYVIDVQNLSSPFIAHRLDGPACNSDHNLIVRGDRVYEAHYSAGLRVVDATNPLSLSEIGFFDTHPESNLVGTFAAWGVYPFPNDRVVLISDTQRGLFVLCDEPSVPVPSLTVSANQIFCTESLDISGVGSTTCDPARSIVLYEWDLSYKGTFNVDVSSGTPGPITIAGGTLAPGGAFIGLRVTDDLGATEITALWVDITNRDPVANAGGPYISPFGAGVALDGSASTDPDSACGDSITGYDWDLDNDGAFDDATGSTPTVPWATILSLGLNTTGSPNTIGLRVRDALTPAGTGSATTTLTITTGSGGACCQLGGTVCTVSSAAACTTAGGRHLGDGTPCSGDGNGNGYDDACEQEIKVSQPPTEWGEDIASNIDLWFGAANNVVKDDFVSDGREITGVRWWGSNIGPTTAAATSVPAASDVKIDAVSSRAAADGSVSDLAVTDPGTVMARKISVLKPGPKAAPPADGEDRGRSGNAGQRISSAVGGNTCATATVIGGLPYSDTGNTCSFTDDYDEICPFPEPGSPDVVYVYSPSVDVIADISLCGDSAYDTKLYVYKNVCGAFQSGTAIACNDDACPTPSYADPYVSSLLGVPLFSGDTYYIVVDGYGGLCGDYTIDIDENSGVPACPANSLAAQPVDAINGFPGFVDSDTDGIYVAYERVTGVSAPIGQLKWWGLQLWDDGVSLFTCDEPTMPFSVKFYQDSAGVPGAEVCSYTMSPTRVDTGYMVQNIAPVYEWIATLDTPCAISDGWISIEGVGSDPSCWFWWLSSAVGDGTSVGWDGASYINLGTDLSYCLSGEQPEIDGWLVSFHQPGPSLAPPLGLYFCDADLVADRVEPLNACDAHPVHRYDVDLASCCRLVAETDPRSGLVPAQVGGFAETECLDYGIDIEAVVGAEYYDTGSGDCGPIVPTGRTTPGDFWGWHTTENMIGPSGLYPFVGPAESGLILDVFSWDYFWVFGVVVPTCSEPNMAFELLTTESGGGADDDGDGIVDSCECFSSSPIVPDACCVDDGFGRNVRHLSLMAGDPGQQQAIRVRLDNLDPPFDAYDGQVLWVGPPVEVTENAGKTDPNDPLVAGFPTYFAAELQCSPHYMDWHGVCGDRTCVGGANAGALCTTAGDCPGGACGDRTCLGGLKAGELCTADSDCQAAVHVLHETIVPSSYYRVDVIEQLCDTNSPSSYSSSLFMITSKWGDIIKDCGGLQCGPPDGVINITSDVTSVLNKFKNLIGAPIKARADLDMETPDMRVNISDVTWCLEGFGGFLYPFPAVWAGCP